MMEYAQIVAFLSDKTPEFVIGFCSGTLIALILSYLYLMPRMVKSATDSLAKQVELLTIQVASQTSHIAHLELQINKLESELGPYRQFAEQQLAKILSASQQL